MEGYKNPSPLSWAWFGAVRIERKPLRYEQDFRRLLHHTHPRRRPLSYFLSPAPDKEDEHDEEEDRTEAEAAVGERASQPSTPQTPADKGMSILEIVTCFPLIKDFLKVNEHLREHLRRYTHLEHKCFFNRFLEGSVLRNFDQDDARKSFPSYLSCPITGAVPLIAAPITSAVNMPSVLNVQPNLSTNQVTVPDSKQSKPKATKQRKRSKPCQKKMLQQQQQQQQYLVSQQPTMMFGQSTQQQQQQAFFQQAPQQRGLQPGLQPQAQQR